MQAKALRRGRFDGRSWYKAKEKGFEAEGTALLSELLAMESRHFQKRIISCGL